DRPSRGAVGVRHGVVGFGREVVAGREEGLALVVRPHVGAKSCRQGGGDKGGVDRYGKTAALRGGRRRGGGTCRRHEGGRRLAVVAAVADDLPGGVYAPRRCKIPSGITDQPIEILHAGRITLPEEGMAARRAAAGSVRGLANDEVGIIDAV